MTDHPSPATDNRTRRITLTFDGTTAPDKLPSVSLCMIVKNEEDTLAECLRSVGDFPAEIIVVDTGSTDRTVAIAESFGAKVYHFQWIDDFAAARNDAIRRATGEWVFWMDADDRISPENLARLKQALASNAADVYSARIVSPNAQHRQSRSIAHHLRLFRNGLGLSFIYPLHEDLNLAAASRPLTVAYTNIEIEHVGYVLGDDLFKQKTRRNLKIIRKCLAKDPQSVRWHHHLGMSLAILGDHPAAIRALAFVIAQGGRGIGEVEFYYTHLWLISLYSKTRRFNAAETLLRQAMQRFPQRQHLFIAAGMFYLDRDDPETARRWLEQAQQLPPESLSMQGQTWLPGTLDDYLGQTYLLLGDVARARAQYRRSDSVSAAKNPVAPGELHKLEIELARGNAALVAERLASRANGLPFAQKLLARAYHRRHAWSKAVAAQARAVAIGTPTAEDWRLLAAALILKTGKTHSAARLCDMALRQFPADSRLADLQAFIRRNADIWQSVAETVSAALNADRRDRALSALRHIADLLDISTTELLRQHGMRCINAKNYSAAVEAFALLVELAPTDTAAYKSLGVALNGVGMADDAVAVWKVAQQLENQTG